MPNSFLPYKKNLKDVSRKLRNNSTLAEVLLWNEIKSGKIRGYKFNRQKPLINFVVDFYCKNLNLVIEIDGDSHIDNKDADTKRQKELEKLKIDFLRFDEIEVKQDLNGVLNRIEKFI